MRSRTEAQGIPMSHRTGRIAVQAVSLGLLVATGCSRVVATPAAGAAPPIATAATAPVASVDGCWGPAVVTSGERRLALIVAVGKFADPDTARLEGPLHDAKKMYDLLTDERGYAFPKQNVCVLVNEQATLEAFDRAFKAALVDRAEKGKSDPVVIYYSGHGATEEDLSGDEVNGYDQTWVLYDSRLPGKNDLLDDHVFELLAELGKKTSAISVILDSCHSGSAIRAGGLVARYAPRPRSAEPEKPPAARPANPTGARTKDIPAQIPGLVLLAATRDESYAYETGARGIFTDALVRVLSRVGQGPLTYGQVQNQVRNLVAAESPQVPQFEGDLDRVVFGNQTRRVPLGLRVKSIAKDRVVLTGSLVPGLGPGAELRVYPRTTLGPDAADPAKSIATVRVESDANALEVVTTVVQKGPAKGALEEDDLAVLVRAAEKFVQLKVQVRQEERPGGVPAERVAAICARMASDGEARETVRLVLGARAATLCAAAPATDEAKKAFHFLSHGEPADLEISLASDGVLELRDSRDQLRKRYATGEGAEPADVTMNLWAHARQLALLNLTPEGGAAFTENKTLKVRIVPNTDQLPCRQGSFREPVGSEPYHLPICFRYLVEVELSEDSPVALRVGGLFLSSDGTIVALTDQADNALQKGKKKILGGIISGPPDGAQDRILVIGTQDRNPINFKDLAASGGLRKGEEAGTAPGTLQRALGRYLHTTRSGEADDKPVDDSAWTRTVVLTEVHANPEFDAPPTAGTAAAQEVPKPKEYTIASYDIRPFLPRNPESALRKVLLQGDWLASYSGKDGVPYKQHDWSQGSDEANLKVGIDCSRTMHFVFTRAGLPYNKAVTKAEPLGRYLTTAEMAKDDGPMADYFDRCDRDPLPKTGDVLVYRDDVKGDGHTVMVVDPPRRVALGSHGWDGNATPGTKGDTGVEYQLIKYKPDWARWDRTTMNQRACWRYRKFTREAELFDNRPGSLPIEVACKRSGCGKVPALR
jgi:hypothetical protein